MKKIITSMMLFAVAAMAFVSCQKNEVAPKYEQTTLTFTSANPNTRTEWNSETIVWSAGDKIRMALTIGNSWYTDANGKVKYYVSKEADLSDGSQTAKFEISSSFDTELSGNYQFYALYPSSCTGTSTDFTNAPNATYTIASEQIASSQTFDKSADILWGKAVNTYTSLPKGEQISLMWNRLVAHAYITLKGLPAGETINKVTLTAQEGAALVGKYNVDITTGAVSENTPANSVLVNCEGVTVGQDDTATFWACINPCNVTSLNIVVDTDKAVYSIDKTNLDLDFLVNRRNVQPVNMSGAERVEKDATGAALPFEETFDALKKGDHNSTGSTSLSTELPNFDIPSGASLYEANGAIRLAKSGVEGSLTTIPLDLSSEFYVKVRAKGWDSDEVKLTVKAGTQSQDIDLITYNPGDFVEYVVNFNAVDNSESVAFSTASGVRVFIDEIEIGNGSAIASPMIVAHDPTKVSADGGAGEIAYTVYNEIEGVNLTASTNQSWLTIGSTTGGKVTFTAAANDATEERTATVILTYGTATEAVTVTQEAKTSGEIVLPASASLEFDTNKNNRTDYSTKLQIWEQNGVKLVNEKASSTSSVGDYGGPARFYKNSSISIEYSGAQIYSVEFVCNKSTYVSVVKTSVESLGTVTTNGTVVKLELLTPSTSVVIAAVSGALWLDSITVHSN